MNNFRVNSSKGQIKIQQMAFVLVALVVFFILAGLVFLSLRVADIEESAEDLRQEEAQEIANKISSKPEFSFEVEDCSNCVDLDKILILKNRTSYEGFWKFDYLRFEKLYPSEEGECNRFSYPECRDITLIESDNFGTPATGFIGLCRWEEKDEGYYKCELGRVYISGENVR